MKPKVTDYRPFWHILPQDILVGSSPKCGASTLQSYAVLNKGGGKKQRVLGCEFDCKKYFFVRDPVARFISLYRDKCLADTVRWNVEPIRGLSVTELIEFIEGGTIWNQHWGRQSEILGDTDATILPLESMSELLDVGILNKSSGTVDLPQNIIDRVYAHYAADKVLYDTSTRNENEKERQHTKDATIVLAKPI